MRRTTTVFASLLLAAGLLTACGSDEDTQSRVVVLLTDAPGDFEKVPIEITALQARLVGQGDRVQNKSAYQQAAAQGEEGLVKTQTQTQDQVQDQSQDQSQSGDAKQQQGSGGEGEGQWVQLMQKAQQQDLLQLQDGKTAQLGDVDAPAGFYNRLRIKLASCKVVVDGETHDLDVPAEGIELAFMFELKAGAGHEMVVDFDAKQSIQMKADGSGYELKPVIEVKQFRHTYRHQTQAGEGQGDGTCKDSSCAQQQPADCKEGTCQQDPSGQASGEPSTECKEGTCQQDPAGEPPADCTDGSCQQDPPADPADCKDENCQPAEPPKGE